MADKPKASDDEDSPQQPINRSCMHSNDTGICDLHLAICKNNPAMFNQLMDINVDLNCLNIFHETPLVLGIKNGFSPNLTKRLINLGCDVNSSDAYKRTPLHIAIWNNDISIAHELIEHGADLNAQDIKNNTPLFYAVIDNNIEAACMLLCYGVNVTIKNSENLIALTHALQNNNLGLVHILLDYHADLNDIDNNGCSLLDYVISRYGDHLAMRFLDAGIDVNTITNYGCCALHYALALPGADLFKKIWSVMNINILLEMDTPMLVHYIHTQLDFARYEWVECLYLMLESSIAVSLVQQCHEYYDSKTMTFFTKLLQSLRSNRIALADCQNIINIYLTLGGEMTVPDLDMVIMYGFETELRAVIYTAEDYVRDNGTLLHPLLPLIIGLSDFNMHDVAMRCIELASSVRSWQICTPIQIKNIIMRCVGCFSLTPLWKRALLHQCQWFFNDSEKIEVATEFPSLLELSRNRVHSLVKEGRKAQKPYQFHDAVNSLPIPTIVRDMLLFRRPIYKLPN